MTSQASTTVHDRPAAGILFILIGMAAITFNDMLIKFMSGGYPLHQMVFVRSAIGIMLSLVIVKYEGGLAILRTRTPGLHVIRCILIVIANMSFFTALAVVPLAEATALFFVAPLLITVLSVPLLGERVGPLRIGAVVVGFAGVVVMLRPWEQGAERTGSIAILLLPVIGATAYALNQILTRKLGATTRASALAVYIQLGFIIVSTAFYLIAGDGRFAADVENESVIFLLRAWVWPQGNDLYLFIVLGLNSAVVAYTLAQAYRLADAATIAPFEYTGLPLAVFWGWLIWSEIPQPAAATGMVLIAGAGLFVFLREQHKRRRPTGAVRPVRRF